MGHRADGLADGAEIGVLGHAAQSLDAEAGTLAGTTGDDDGYLEFKRLEETFLGAAVLLAREAA